MSRKAVEIPALFFHRLSNSDPLHDERSLLFVRKEEHDQQQHGEERYVPLLEKLQPPFDLRVEL